MTASRRRTVQALAGAGALVAGTLAMAPGAVQAVTVVPASSSGTVEVWGADGAIADGLPVRVTYPSADGPWAAVSLGSSGTDFAITSTGSLRRLTGSSTDLAVPTALASATVKAVDVHKNKAAAVSADGSVQIWGGRGVSNQVLTPAALGANAVDVEVGTTAIAILLQDGRVGLVTGLAPAGYRFAEATAGGDITGADKIAFSGTTGVARTAGGGLVGFSAQGDTVTPPAALSVDEPADPVTDFDAGGNGVAVTESGQVYVWDLFTGELLDGGSANFPSEAVEGEVVDVAATSRYFVAVTDADEVEVWGQDDTAPDFSKMAVPEEVDGRQIADVVGSDYTFGAILTAPLPDLAVDTAPSVAGQPQVGQTLTGTPATFIGSPDAVANQWFAGDAPIAGATGTTLVLTPAQLGQNVTFRSTATRGEVTPVVSTSPATGPVVAAPAVTKIASTTVVSSPTSTYGTAGSATVTVGNAGGRQVAGTVTLTGAGAPQTAALSGGSATFALDKALAAGSYTLTATYAGSVDLNPSSGSVGHAVAKAKTKRPTFKANKAPTSKKKGKATVTVTAPSGLAKATGKVTITIKGTSKKTIKTTLSGGKKSISLPKLKKGSYKVTVSYAGDKNYVAQKSSTFKLKIKK